MRIPVCWNSVIIWLISWKWHWIFYLNPLIKGAVETFLHSDTLNMKYPRMLNSRLLANRSFNKFSGPISFGNLHWGYPLRNGITDNVMTVIDWLFSKQYQTWGVNLHKSQSWNLNLVNLNLINLNLINLVLINLVKRQYESHKAFRKSHVSKMMNSSANMIFSKSIPNVSFTSYHVRKFVNSM